MNRSGSLPRLDPSYHMELRWMSMFLLRGKAPKQNPSGYTWVIIGVELLEYVLSLLLNFKHSRFVVGWWVGGGLDIGPHIHRWRYECHMSWMFIRSLPSPMLVVCVCFGLFHALLWAVLGTKNKLHFFLNLLVIVNFSISFVLTDTGC